MPSSPSLPSTRALEEARVRLDRELAKHPDDPKLLMLRGRADERLEQFEEAAGFFQRAARVFKSLGDRQSEASAILAAASAFGRGGELARAQLLFLRAIATHDELGDEVAAARARVAHAKIQIAADHRDEAQSQLELALEPLERAEDWELLGWVQEKLTEIAMRAGDAKRALHIARAAVESAAKAKDRPRFGERLAQVAALHKAEGNWGKARQYQEKAMPYLREAEAWIRVLDGYTMLIDAAMAEDASERAEELIHEAIEVADRLRKPMYQGRIRARHGELLFERGEVSAAREVLDVAVSQLQLAGDLRSSAPTFEILGRVHWRLGNRKETLWALDRASWMHDQLGDDTRAGQVALMRTRAAAGDWSG